MLHVTTRNFVSSGAIAEDGKYLAFFSVNISRAYIVTRRGQIHVYQPLLANSRDGYWPAGALMEGDASTGKWQELTPRLSNTCVVFPHSGTLTQAQQGDYAWALWRPYACCERRGQVFLGSVDFL